MEKYVVSVAVNGRLIVEADSIEDANTKAFQSDFCPEDLYNGEVVEVFHEFDDDNNTVTLEQWRKEERCLMSDKRYEGGTAMETLKFEVRESYEVVEQLNQYLSTLEELGVVSNVAIETIDAGLAMADLELSAIENRLSEINNQD